MESPLKKDEVGTYIDPSYLYHIRLLVFMEAKPGSNDYFQVILNEEEFKKLSDTVGSLYRPETTLADGSHRAVIRTSLNSFKLPDLPDAYSEEELKRKQ